jgi:dolichol-phosphate mannosyltransferase
LREARRYAHEILVVDDGSTDSTPSLLRTQPDLHVIAHAENRGYGKSLADAFAFARRTGYDWLITMDCDEQHEPAQIPIFLAAAGFDDADIISGTRYPGGHDESSAAPRAASSTIAAYRHSVVQAYRVLRAHHRSGYAMPMQMWVQVARAVPVTADLQ